MSECVSSRLNTTHQTLKKLNITDLKQKKTIKGASCLCRQFSLASVRLADTRIRFKFSACFEFVGSFSCEGTQRKPRGKGQKWEKTRARVRPSAAPRVHIALLFQSFTSGAAHVPHYGPCQAATQRGLQRCIMGTSKPIAAAARCRCTRPKSSRSMRAALLFVCSYLCANARKAPPQGSLL